MKIKNLAALSVVTSLVGACSTIVPVTSPLYVDASTPLPDCLSSNYDKEQGLFTMKNIVANQVNQQCLLTVGPRGSAAPENGFTAGSYNALLSNGGAGGGGGSIQTGTTSYGVQTGTTSYGGGDGGGSIQTDTTNNGGGGGGGAGAQVQRATLELSEGTYRLTIGAGGRGGNACNPPQFGGGPGWAGSPSNIVRVATAEVIMGTPGAERYIAPTRAQNDRLDRERDGHGGSGPMQTTGGRGGSETMAGIEKAATSGAGVSTYGGVVAGGAAGTDTDDKSRSGGGGGGGATQLGGGGSGGGEVTTATVSSSGKERVSKPVYLLPIRGSLGSGGGGGEGSSWACEAGAAGGHGFISLRAF